MRPQSIDLANQMDELSHRAQDVLQRYEDASSTRSPAQILNGGAGLANSKTGAEVKEAQLKIQTRFQQRQRPCCAAAPAPTPTPTSENAQQVAARRQQPALR